MFLIVENHFKAPTPEPTVDKDVVDLTNNFVRINVKHITEGRGIVDGTLLLTSKTVMFDPYLHHPLVIIFMLKYSSLKNHKNILRIKIKSITASNLLEKPFQKIKTQFLCGIP